MKAETLRLGQPLPAKAHQSLAAMRHEESLQYRLLHSFLENPTHLPPRCAASDLQNSRSKLCLLFEDTQSATNRVA